MNMTDGGENRKPMRLIGTQGCRSVLESRGMWRDGMKLTDARDTLWHWKEVCKQKTIIEQLCNETGIVLIYEPKAHPVFNPSEVRTSCFPQSWFLLEIFLNSHQINVKFCLIFVSNADWYFRTGGGRARGELKIFSIFRNSARSM